MPRNAVRIREVLEKIDEDFKCQEHESHAGGQHSAYPTRAEIRRGGAPREINREIPVDSETADTRRLAEAQVYTFAAPDQELAAEYTFSTWHKREVSGARDVP
jgi:hypothetical protein